VNPIIVGFADVLFENPVQPLFRIFYLFWTFDVTDPHTMSRG
jgi:methyl coenzyme M reductase gamma subunit